MSTTGSPVMCIGLGCPIRETCWRCRGIPLDQWTSWFEQLPYDFMRDRCHEFVELGCAAGNVGELRSRR